ncbi:MAG: elongation factor G, partial [Spirochaetales bacterium]|nr:elongation factor G [Candidatus Physcosoma equi]
YREELIEKAAEGADDLIEKYFDEGALTDDEIRRGLREGMARNSVVPVFVGSAEKGAGITSFLNFIRNNFPIPTDAYEYTIKEDGSIARDYKIGDDCSLVNGYCFKTTIDQFSGKMSFIKVVNGKLTGETQLTNIENGKRAAVGKVYRAVGKKLIEVDALNAGDIGIVTKFEPAETNATLTSNAASKIKFRPLRLPLPVYELAISASDKKSEDKMNDALHKVTEEDLTFVMKYNEETKESIIGGMGELHINMILDKIKEKQKIAINTKTPRIAYRETITKKSGLAEYSHKKQSGGHGQFGRVVIEIYPIERGQYYEFQNTVKGGAVSKGYVPGIEKGIHEKMEEGFLAGYPLVDIGVNLSDGKEHPVDSSEMAFKLAAKGAMDIALEKAGCVILEPFGNLEVLVESDYLGAILSDLSSRRGRVLGQEEKGHMTSVKAEVPMAEMRTYAIDLKSMTQGSGSFEVAFDHYETLNGALAKDVIAEAQREKEAQA